VRELAKAVEAIGTPDVYEVIGKGAGEPDGGDPADAPGAAAPAAIPVTPLNRPKFASGPIPHVVRAAAHGTGRVVRLRTAHRGPVHGAMGLLYFERIVVAARPRLPALDGPDMGALAVARPLADAKRTWAAASTCCSWAAPSDCWPSGWTAMPFPAAAPRPTAARTSCSGQCPGQPRTLSIAMQYLFYYGLAVAACRWWVITDPKRKERFRLFPIVAAGSGRGSVFLWPWQAASPALAFAPLIIAAVCVQVTSPWISPAQASPVRPVARPVGENTGMRKRDREAVGLEFGSVGLEVSDMMPAGSFAMICRANRAYKPRMPAAGWHWRDGSLSIGAFGCGAITSPGVARTRPRPRRTARSPSGNPGIGAGRNQGAGGSSFRVEAQERSCEPVRKSWAGWIRTLPVTVSARLPSAPAAPVNPAPPIAPKVRRIAPPATHDHRTNRPQQQPKTRCGGAKDARRIEPVSSANACHGYSVPDRGRAGTRRALKIPETDRKALRELDPPIEYLPPLAVVSTNT